MKEEKKKEMEDAFYDVWMKQNHDLAKFYFNTTYKNKEKERNNCIDILEKFSRMDIKKIKQLKKDYKILEFRFKSCCKDIKQLKKENKELKGALKLSCNNKLIKDLTKGIKQIHNKQTKKFTKKF